MPRTRQALEWDIANTIIEDSEPEREAEELRLKIERRPRKRVANTPSPQEDAGGFILPAPEANRKESWTGTTHGRTESTYFMITDDSQTVQVQEIPAAKQHVLPGVISRSPSIEELQKETVPPPKVPIDYDTITRPINLDDHVVILNEPVGPRMNLDRFAFARPGPSAPKAASARPSIEPIERHPSAESSDNTKKPNKQSRVTPLPSFASDFTTEELTAVTKCVVCDLAWTTRKTVPLKMTHMKSCAKKNGWSEQTVKVKLTMLIEARSTTPAGTANKPVTPKAPPTLLENVIDETAPKRRKKAKEITMTTVADPTQAHNAILERAKVLFGDPIQVMENRVQRMPTLQFPPTRLGVPASGMLGQALVDERNSAEASKATNLPPATQAFKPSNLQSKFKGRSILQSLGGDTPEEDVEMEDATTSARPSNPVFPHKPFILPSQPLYLRTSHHASTSNSLNESIYLPATTSKKLEELDRRLAAVQLGDVNMQQSRGFSTAVPLEKEKETEKAKAKTKTKTTTKSGKGQESGEDTDAPIRRKARTSRSASPESTSLSKERSKPRNRTNKIKSRSKSRNRRSRSRSRTKSPMKRLGDDALDEKLREIILNDSALYLKILRFEPIHFDTFMNIPEVIEIAGEERGFRGKMMAFLDRHAINFYGDAALSTGRRARYN
ncbi:hypothetical protein M422DRAFT_773488 [Sphaerobolus stellatus SS14]|nr:hypothetical protein M422DRAFT_773488 [Sphaerobolus stellatus SS14]